MHRLDEINGQSYVSSDSNGNIPLPEPTLMHRDFLIKEMASALQCHVSIY